MKRLGMSVLVVLFAPLTAVTPAAAALPSFTTSGIQVRALPPGSLPFQSRAALPAAGTGLIDAGGVRMFSLYGRIWNHPVGQAQYALANLDSYRLTGKGVYLDRAIANAQRLVNRSVVAGKAWFFPYPFDFACCQGDTSMVLHAPWYSGMAQGEALSIFVRLFEVTGDPEWRVAADAAFASLLLPPSHGRPWVTWVDADGHLWLDEYPRWPAAKSERVLNGHIFAVFGLYDYIQLANDPQALQLFDGAVTTVEQLFPEFRRVNWAAAYSLGHGIPATGYQHIVISQLLHLHHMTGRIQEALFADILRADFPIGSAYGSGTFTSRATICYKLDSHGNIVGSRPVAFPRQTSAPVNRRSRTASGRIMLRVSAGPYADWWFPEASGVAWISGPVDAHDYDPMLAATFSPGTFDAYSYDARGLPTGVLKVTVASATTWPTTGSAVVDGRLAYYLASGPFAGFWVPAKAHFVAVSQTYTPGRRAPIASGFAPE